MNIIAERKTKTSIWFYIFVYYLIIGSDCIVFCYNQNQLWPKLSQYFMVFLAFSFLIISNYRKQYIFKKDIILIITIVFLLLCAVVHSEFSGGYISIISLFILGNCFFDVIDSEKFVKAFINIMTAICVVSLITFVFSTYLSNLSFIPSLYNTKGFEYKFFFLSNILVIEPRRNFGIFTEPSRYQAYLNLGLMFLMFTDKKLDLKRIILFVVCLITTFSTTGFIGFVLILVAFLFSNKVKMNVVNKVLMMSCLGIVVGLLALQNDYFSYSIKKLFMGDKSVSASTRFNSFFATLKIISENFIFGTGVGNADAAFANALSDLGGLFASTNTITILIIFSKFGLVPGLFYTYNMFNAVNNISNRKNTLILIIAFIAMTSGISFVDSIIFNIIIFYRRKLNNYNSLMVEFNENFSC